MKRKRYYFQKLFLTKIYKPINIFILTLSLHYTLNDTHNTPCGHVGSMVRLWNKGISVAEGDILGLEEVIILVA